MASENGHLDVIQTLLAAGADMNIARSDVSLVVFLLWCSHSAENVYFVCNKML